jgi:hypothetical protein
VRERLTYANVVATLALFLALTGGAVWAADQITSQDIAKRAVRTQNLADNAVKSPQIKNNSVNSGDIRDQNITGEDIAENTIETSDLKDGAVKGGKVFDGSLTGADLQNGTVSPGKLALLPGDTIRGAVGADFNAAAAEEDFGVVASLPVPAATPLTDDDVFINESLWSTNSGQAQPTTSDTSPGCAGTLAEPTAPPGKVCIYLAGGDNAKDVNGYSVLPGAGGSRFGFKLGWTSVGDSDTFIDAVWAYRAP